MTSEPTEEAQAEEGQGLDMNIVWSAFGVAGAVLIAVDAAHWAETLLLFSSLAVTLLLLLEWNAGRFSRAAIPALGFTAAVWVLGALVFDAPTSAYGFAVTATLIAFELPRGRGVLLTGAAAVALTVLALKPVVPGSDGQTFGDIALFVCVSLGVAFGGVAVAVLARAVKELIGRLDRGRHRDSELALLREQVRYSGDLHEAQDRTLNAVEDKVDLAEEHLHSDLDRVRRELDGVRTLIGANSIETKGLVHAQRRLHLAAELENAKNRLEAAGVHVQVGRADGVDTSASALLGEVLREATTNILSHTGAEQVRITLTWDGLSVVNDGAGGDGRLPALPALSGLGALRERLVGHGGELVVEQDGSWFRTVATVPAPDNGTVPTARADHR